MKKIILMLLLVLLVAGCVSPFDFFSQKTEVKEQPEDVISIQNINVLPPPPIIAGDQFSVSFELSNLEEEKNVDVGYKLMDDGLCERVSGPEYEIFPGFVPGRVEFIEWTFDTPSSEEIGYLSTTCPIRFIIGYQFTAVSEIEANVMTEDRYYQLQQSGEFSTFTPTLNVGRGPIKIYMEFGASFPIRTDRVLPVYITVQDKGAGLLTEIPGNEEFTGKELLIEVPRQFGVQDCGERFICGDIDTTDDYEECWNTDELIFIKRETPTIKCSFTTPGEDVVEVEQTYFITTSLFYPYNLTQKVDVRVTPLEA